MKKKWIFFALIFCLTAGITGSVVYAYLVDQKEKVNQIKIAENQSHIEEEFDPPTDPKPGQIIKKKPCIINDSEIPVYVRAMVKFSNSAAEEQCEPLLINTQWKKGKDGYFYYQEEVPPKEKTKTLFDNIVIKSTTIKENLVPFDILVYEESVQSEGFSSAEEAFSKMQEGPS